MHPSRKLDRLIRAAIGGLILSAPLGLAAQTVQRIDASQKQSCAGCSIVLTKVATLGSINEDEFPGVAGLSGFAVDSKGRIYATSMRGDLVLMYAPNGKYLQKIGRKGGGPDEFDQALKLFVGKNDSLFVLNNTRISVFSAAQEFVRSVPYTSPTALQFLVLANSEIVMDAGIHQNTQIANIISTDNAVRRVEANGASTVPRCPRCGPSILAASSNLNNFWVAMPNAFEIEEWGANGKQARSVSVTKSTWMTNWPTTTVIDRDTRPLPRLAYLAEDNRGQLWAAGTYHTPSWTPPPPPASATRGAIGVGGRVTSPERLKFVVSHVDVFDLATSRLVISQQFEGRLLRMLSAEYFAEAREDENDIPVMDVFRATIKRP